MVLIGAWVQNQAYTIVLLSLSPSSPAQIHPVYRDEPGGDVIRKLKIRLLYIGRARKKKKNPSKKFSGPDQRSLSSDVLISS